MADTLLPRHDGHKVKDHGYHKANNNIVKYGFWVLVVLFLCAWLAVRVYRTFSRASKRDKKVQLRQEDKAMGIRAIPGHVTRQLNKVSNIRVASSKRWIQYLAPPATGQVLFLSVYWALLLAGLWTNVIFKSPSEVFGIQWEVVGFRAAWVSTMQLPLLYATGCRFNIISLMTGITHERLNWFHRWIARTVFMTLIVHWAFFYREWDIAGFVRQEFEVMPMVIWGFVAWGAIGLMVITGFGWFRDRHFELWLISHIALAWAVLALSYKHTHCTTYFVGASVGMLVFDLAGRAVSVLLRNVLIPRSLSSIPYLGHRARLEVLDDDYLRLVVNDPSFKWKAGQHVYLYVPRVRPLESHPFTVLGAMTESGQPKRDSLSLIIKSHAGFTKSLHKAVSKTPNCQLRVFLQGPYGNPPNVHERDTTILVATGNRASVSVSLLLEMACRPRGPDSDLIFHWIVPSERMTAWYREELRRCIRAFQLSKSTLSIYVHVTRGSPTASHKNILLGSAKELPDDPFTVGGDSMDSDCSSETLTEKERPEDHPQEEEEQSLLSKAAPITEPQAAALEKQSYDEEAASPANDAAALWDPYDETLTSMLTPEAGKGTDFSLSYSRPSADELIRPTLSETEGSIAIMAAVPPVLAADLGKAVNRLLDEYGRDIDLWIDENGS